MTVKRLTAKRMASNWLKFVSHDINSNLTSFSQVPRQNVTTEHINLKISHLKMLPEKIPQPKYSFQYFTFQIFTIENVTFFN